MIATTLEPGNRVCRMRGDACSRSVLSPGTNQNKQDDRSLTPVKASPYKFLHIGLYDDSYIAMQFHKAMLKELFGDTTKICLTSRADTVRLWIIKCSIDILIMDPVQMGTEYPLDVIRRCYNEYVERRGTEDGFPKIIFNTSSPRWVVEDVVHSKYPFLSDKSCFVQKPGKRSDIFNCILNLLGNPEEFFEGNDKLVVMRNLVEALDRAETKPSIVDGLKLAIRSVFVD